LTQYPVPAERVSVVFEGDDGDARARHGVTSVFASARVAQRDARRARRDDSRAFGDAEARGENRVERRARARREGASRRR
jgi:hypothetical protein